MYLAFLLIKKHKRAQSVYKKLKNILKHMIYKIIKHRKINDLRCLNKR